jgi:cyclase
MLRSRIIPTLLIRNRGLVKTRQFKDGIYLGDPVNAIKIFNEKQVDELIIFDIDATRLGKGIDWQMLNRLNCEAFMPLGYGGGIKTCYDVERIINLGYEKVVINSAVHTNAALISEASELSGSQSIVVCIDICKSGDGSFKVFDYLTMKPTDIDPLDYCKMVANSGAGEIIIQSADREGTWTGYESEILKEISTKVTIPVIALGGASSINDVKEILKTEVSAAAAGSIFVFFGRLKAVLINYPDPEELWQERI